MNYIIVLIFIFISIGLYYIVCDLLNVPFTKTSKAVISTASKAKKVKTKDVLIHDFTHFVSRFIRIDTYKRESMQEKFKIAGISLTPEQFIAKALLRPFLFGALTIILLWIFPLASIITGAFAILLYLKEFEEIELQIAKKRKAIELELNRFVAQISKYIEHNKDVLTILEMYQKYAGADFGNELKITIADMRSGNQETALTRLESRVNSTALSDVVRGLIAVIQGNSTKTYWETLSIKFSELSRQQLKKQANKIPGKVNRCTVAIVLCFVAMIMVVLGTNLIESAGMLKM